MDQTPHFGLQVLPLEQILCLFGVVLPLSVINEFLERRHHSLRQLIPELLVIDLSIRLLFIRLLSGS